MGSFNNAALQVVEDFCSPKLMFVGRQDLHTRVLAQYLSNALFARCDFDYESGGSGKTLSDTLTMIDCKHHDHDAVEKRLEGLYRSDPASRAVLLNAKPSSDVEGLLQWPTLKGIFFEDCCQERLLKGMRKVLGGGLWMPRRLVEQSFERQRQAMPPRPSVEVKLSPRELDILQCVSNADSNSDIASNLHISEHTVKTHIYNIFRKIGVRNRTEASHWAMLNLKGQS